MVKISKYFSLFKFSITHPKGGVDMFNAAMQTHDDSKQKIKKHTAKSLKLEKTLEKFRARELSEIKAIEKYTLNLEKEDYKAFQKRIDEIKEKYRTLRNERLRKRVEELGVTLSDQATVEEIRQKEKEYLERYEKGETKKVSTVKKSETIEPDISEQNEPEQTEDKQIEFKPDNSPGAMPKGWNPPTETKTVNLDQTISKVDNEIDELKKELNDLTVELESEKKDLKNLESMKVKTTKPKKRSASKKKSKKTTKPKKRSASKKKN